VLLKVFDNPNESRTVRTRAAMALTGHLDSSHPAVIPRLRRALREGSPEERTWVISALTGHLDTAGDRFLPELMRALKGPDDQLACMAGSALGMMGQKAAKALPELLIALGERRSRYAAALALHGIPSTDPAVLDRLIEQLGVTDDPRGLVGVIRVVAKHGPAAAKAVPHLIVALDNAHIDQSEVMDDRHEAPHKPVQVEAILAIGRIGKAAKAAVPRLYSIASGTKEPSYTRQCAVTALKRIDPAVGKKAETILNSQVK
jgi:HEAT repeat protein